jgi:hypothetical protein
MARPSGAGIAPTTTRTRTKGRTGDAGGYRWVVEDVAYAPVWSAPDPAALRDEYAMQRPFSDLKDTTR